MNTTQPQKITLLAAWVVVILTSMLPMVILQEIFKQQVSGDQRAIISFCVIGAALLATLIWKPLRGLLPFLALFAALVGIQWLVSERLDTLPFLRRYLRDPSFNVYMLAEEALNLIVTLVIIAALFLLGKKRQDFYLAKGDISAPAERVRWLGIKQGDPWNHVGVALSFFISLGTIAFLAIAGRPSLDIIVRALPYLPAILLAAALNSFTEEVTYKASFLSVLEGPVGPRQAVYMVAVYFGMAHFYGIPYGVTGVLLAAFMGWLLAKSMQETRGLFWAWFIHFLQDVWIFAFLAIGSITPGG